MKTKYEIGQVVKLNFVIEAIRINPNKEIIYDLTRKINASVEINHPGMIEHDLSREIET